MVIVSHPIGVVYQAFLCLFSKADNIRIHFSIVPVLATALIFSHTKRPKQTMGGSFCYAS